MGSSNLPLIAWYGLCGLIGALLYKKSRIIGAIIGLVVAFVLITIFALLMGP